MSSHLAAVQRRTLRVLFAIQIISGVGIGIGASVGALLAADLAGVGVSGLAPSAIVVGAALLALPATEIGRAMHAVLMSRPWRTRDGSRAPEPQRRLEQGPGKACLSAPSSR